MDLLRKKALDVVAGVRAASFDEILELLAGFGIEPTG
jgi:hypothetical protein